MYRRPYMVTDWLNLTQPPDSLHVLDCGSTPFAFTDVLVHCSISIEPKEFDLLLEGYEFSFTAGKQQTISSEVTWPGNYIGPDYEVSDMYITSPPEFENGGQVSIYASADRSRAIVDLYIE